jgi:methylglutaconyl-CoA hydratase
MSELIVEKRGRVSWITINRPERRNAMNDAVLTGVQDGLRAAESDAEVRAVVLTGAGDKAFCAGADIKKAGEDANAVFAPEDEEHPMIKMFQVVGECHKPLIARVNGHAMGGGMGLVCMCDLVVAADHAKFATPEAKIGVFPMMILCMMLPQIPLRKLKEMAFTAEPLSAGQACEYGIVNQVVAGEELDNAVQSMLDKILANSPVAVQLGKQAFQAMQDMDLAQRMEYAQAMIARMAKTQDAKEGFAAFLEKRKPNWGAS